jgi:membrane fusion protein, heavy metal efflux system
MKRFISICCLFLILLSAAFIFVGCKSSTAETTEQQEDTATRNSSLITLSDAQLPNAGIQTGKIEQHPISGILRVNGQIDVPPQNMESISNPLGGYLKSTKLLPGMYVSRGQVLATMEDQQYIQLQQDYLTAKAELVLNESEYNRQRDLNQDKAVSDKVFEQARAAFQTKNVLVKALEEKLRLIGLNPATVSVNNISRTINLYSPINGFVTEVNVNPGKYVNPSDVLFELVDPTDIHLALTVFEKDLDKLSTGQRLAAYTNNNPDKKYPCSIVLISRSLDSERSAAIHCHFEQYDKILVPGMFMNADIEVKSNNVNALPSDAIVRYENKQYAFVTRGKNQFLAVEVQTGNAENGYTEITKGGQFANETFVVKGAYNLLMKMKNTAEEE